MTESEIVAALNHRGSCPNCGGDGGEPGTCDSRGRDNPCSVCHRTGIDPLALLRAVQAVGHLLRRWGR